MPGTGERRPNIIRGHNEPVVVKDVAFADLSSERLDVGMEFLHQCTLLFRQWRERTLVTVSRHLDHDELSVEPVRH
jgi:hypothetical protein